MTSIIRNESLAPDGKQKIELIRSYMPMLRSLEEEFEETKPFFGTYISMSIRLDPKTAYFAKLFKIGGAKVSITGSNPLSTQDDVAAALAAEGIDVFAYHSCTDEEYKEHLDLAVGCKPNILIDDGGDLVNHLLNEKSYVMPHMMGGCEETTTGLLRLKALEESGLLKFPMIDLNNAYSKKLFDNFYTDGEIVNFASDDGHLAEIMDMSFALQLLSAKCLLNNYSKLGNKVVDVPEEIDKKVVMMKLETLGIKIASLSKEQQQYLEGSKKTCIV